MHGLAVMAYNNLIKNGVTDVKHYWDAAENITHLTHGRAVREGDSEPHENSKWHSLVEGSVPVNLHHELQGTLNTVSNSTVPKDERFNTLHHWAKSSQFVKCNCPTCIIDQFIHPANTVFDTQHHTMAANSKDPALKDAYYHGYPMGYSSKFNERISNLGEIGRRTPHRAFWSSEDAETYIRHAVRGKRDEQHKLFAGLDTAIPFEVPQLDLNLVAQQSGRLHDKSVPIWMAGEEG
jgi:hypothetical protein